MNPFTTRSRTFATQPPQARLVDLHFANPLCLSTKVRDFYRLLYYICYSIADYDNVEEHRQCKLLVFRDRIHKG